MHLLLVDTETGGRDPSKHALLGIGAVLADGDLREIGRFQALVVPFPGLAIDPLSLSVTGLDLGEIAQKGIPEDAALRTFLDMAKDDKGNVPPVLAGWNVSFDEAFLKAAASRHGYEWPFDYKVLDVQCVWAFCEGWDFRGFTYACKRLFGKAPEHGALPDALLTLDILRRLHRNGPRSSA